MTQEDILIYLKVIKELDPLCKKWAENNLKDWMHYDGYTIMSKDKISIIYSYDDYLNNIETYTEFGSIEVPLNEILEYIKNKINKYFNIK